MSDEAKKSQATMLVELALSTADLELFHTADRKAFVMVPAGTHRECVPLRSTGFRGWLGQRFYEDTGKTAGGQALTDALSTLEGEALYHGAEHEVHLRVAEHEGAIYVDLGDEFWQAIEITGSSWMVVADPPVRFRRPSGLRTLPRPVTGGSLDELRQFVNVTDDDWPLVVGWTVAALRDRGPYPVLQLHGEQGSAKSTTARVLRSLVDPNVAALRTEPREARDLMVAAANGWIIGFDNVSHLAPWLSDAMCRLSTGGGFAARELYSDLDEILVDVQRPMLLNGIEELSTRGDLLDRSLIVFLPRITRYRPEAIFWLAFEEARPRIFGALLTAVSTALGNVATVKIARPPRMADFALWATAAEPALGLRSGMFLEAYHGNRADAHALSLEASPLVDPLRQLAEAGFAGTATDLLDRLAGLVDEQTTARKSWPKTANGLSGALRRLAPSLREISVEIEFNRVHGGHRHITVSRGGEKIVTSVTTVTAEASNGVPGDAGDAGDAEIPGCTSDVDRDECDRLEAIGEDMGLV